VLYAIREGVFQTASASLPGPGQVRTSLTSLTLQSVLLVAESM
jgi:hypothetical protein